MDHLEVERGQFEAWHQSLGRPSWMLMRKESGIARGEYVDLRCEAEWEAWQARAALPAAAPAAQPVEPLDEKAENLWAEFQRDWYAARRAELAPAALPPAHVGESNFEGWYADYVLRTPVHQEKKQRARDAYAAGMTDAYAAQPVEPSDDARDAARYKWLRSATLNDWAMLAHYTMDAMDARVDELSASKDPHHDH